MNFLAAGWLWGLGTLLLPVLLHLWRRPRLARIPLGSLRFVPTGRPPPRHSRRLRDWLLLLLRLLVLALLFAWLARPIYWPKASEVVGKWLLVDAAQWPLSADAPGYRRARELLRHGYAARVLPPSQDSWSQIAEADAALSADSPLAVLIDPQVSHLQGNRPVLRHEVEWLPGKSAAAERWTARMQQGRVATGVTSPERTSYEWRAEPSVNNQEPKRDILLVAGPEQAAEAEILTTALQTALEVSGGAAQIRRAEKMGDAELLICLSEQKDFPSRARTILTVANARDLQRVAATNLRQMSHQPLPGRAIWQTDGGEPLLTLEEKDGRRIYHCASRFLPAASDLGESGLLVDWLIRDFLQTPLPVEKDRRTVALAEARSDAGAVERSRLPQQPRNLQFAGWLLLAAALLTERVVSLTRPRRA